MKIIYEEGEACPVCGKNLVERSYGEDDVVYLECPVDDAHYSKCLGYRDDLDEDED